MYISLAIRAADNTKIPVYVSAFSNNFPKFYFQLPALFFTFHSAHKVESKMTAIWDIAPYCLVEVDRRFRGAYCPHLHCDSSCFQTHGAVCQKTIIFIIAAIRIWNLTEVDILNDAFRQKLAIFRCVWSYEYYSKCSSFQFFCSDFADHMREIPEISPSPLV
jgi:hypothetical protein